ncbi:hypothetical protein NDU88_009287 [Pleurodeles waltl]|uniref:Receptor ligand binding region domain-containing protein n=1 Tax=Pleurodeles waltl TaxID=8319 RepID=A0AAV7P7I8_PLEWA|nr:hypothetical protein NDU88_009287 [Pleurodeles waltl]
MIVSDDELGLQGGQHVKQVIEENGGCVAFVERIHLRYSKEKVLQVVQQIQRHSVKVVIVHSAEAYVKVLLETMYSHNVTEKTLIFSAYFVISPAIFADQTWKILNGTLALTLYAGSMPSFKDFLSLLHPDDVFTELLWEQIFGCQLLWVNRSNTTNAAMEVELLAPCSKQETFDAATLSLFELNDMSYTYHSYAAVYAFAHALNKLMECKPGQGPFIDGSCANIKDIQPWQILHYLRNIKFKDQNGEEIFIDVNGDAHTSFNILNIQISQNGDFQLVKVGKIDTTAPEGKEVIINLGAILWGNGTGDLGIMCYCQH